jgi:formate dehydrogenase iron-sulfur subunit
VVTALAGFFHYTRVGPNEVTEEEELEAQEEVAEARRAKERSDGT